MRARRLVLPGVGLLALSLLLALGTHGQVVTEENRMLLAFGSWLGTGCLVAGVGCLLAALVLWWMRPPGTVQQVDGWG